ncbi:MAG: MobQ family relaxase [Caulobacter sp.]|nr:MobQ family relaxase [Caulobacter sp.]
MAIYHLRAKVIQRSNGQSAVKSASYRHGQRLYDERLGRAFSYKKPDVAHSVIIAPDGAPEWVFRRGELWNRVEMAETRNNAQVAREIEISLPRELSPAQRIELVRAFIDEHFVSRGMVADIAIHTPLGADGLEQPHAHVMLTMRRLDATTASGFARTKAREWNEDPEVEAALREAKDAFRTSETPELAALIDGLDKQRNIHVWRAAWAEHANSALAAADAAARVDHRTLAAQGIAREAQPHLGLARHIEKAYAFMKDRVSNWLSVVKRNELYRAFAPYQRRDAAKFTRDVDAISAFTDGLMGHWRKRPRQRPQPVPEVGHEP